MAWRRRLPLGFAASLFMLVGLGCVFGSPDDNPPADVSGTWRFTETLTDQLDGLSCIDTGSYVFTQVRDSFGGTYRQTGVCTSAQGKVSNRQTGTVTAGRIVGIKIVFHVPENCDYGGSLTGSPPRLVAGKGYCVTRDSAGGVVYNYEGPWEAIR